MCNRKMAVIVMTATIAVLLTACNGNSATTGHDTQQTTTVAGTVSQPKSTENSTTASDNVSAEDISKKAEEIKSSMAAAVEQASREAESLAEAARQEAESRAAATQAAGEAVETALREQAAQLANEVIVADGEKHLVQIVFNQVTVEALISHQLLREMPDGHLVLRVIAENPNIHFVGQAFSLQKLRFLNQSS